MRFRKMERQDVPSGLALCRSATWNQLARDWEIFLTLDPEGSRVCVDDDEHVIGTVTTLRYSNHFSWIGMVLVDPAHQRKGIGLKLLEQALEILKNEDSVKLDATPAGRQVYVKLGFKDEYRLSRMSTASLNTQHLVSSTATALGNDDLDSVGLFDQKVFGADRMPLLRWMREGAPDLAFKVGNGGQLRGYCFGRPGYRFTQIGPVVATDADVARELVSAALRHCGNIPVVLDVPHHDESWSAWIQLLGFSELRPFVRMYKGNNHWPGTPRNQYAMLGPEFG
ncbi:GNAT family N-acetyltransferase [Chryseolinea soli]|uniref:GNAT family N-acetyltransferase n=1 Tax=Chryseolinea soli TaxID=2321403 RepID=A0A385T092_9BACT|nr:GNAT family N-acetyltransferase [Chryseolinea soli]AYB34478.1 GNAT family N-acetyltransferase [Chryseolinea soli]